MCEAFKQKMTQKEGFVWFLPGWYHNDWYDVDALREKEQRTLKSEFDYLPNCTTAEMIQVGGKKL